MVTFGTMGDFIILLGLLNLRAIILSGPLSSEELNGLFSWNLRDWQRKWKWNRVQFLWFEEEKGGGNLLGDEKSLSLGRGGGHDDGD